MYYIITQKPMAFQDEIRWTELEGNAGKHLEEIFERLVKLDGGEDTIVAGSPAITLIERVQVLEEEVARLHERIRQLEGTRKQVASKDYGNPEFTPVYKGISGTLN